MSTKAKTQISMDETIVDDKELGKLLEERQELKVSVSEYRKKDKEAKAKIRSIEVTTPFRVGRFVISRSDVTARHVEFETQSSFRFTIKRDGEE